MYLILLKFLCKIQTHMNKFFMLTRGRTGSTAILDEIGTTNILSLQEPFINTNARIPEETMKQICQPMAPFDLWLKSISGKKNQVKNNTLATSLCKGIDSLCRGKWIIGRVAARYLIEQYLNELENLSANKKGIIFKVLSHQLIEKRPLLGVLKSRGYKAILLVRRNVVRQVLSGMLAENRGLYNSRVQVKFPPCSIDLDRFEFCVAWEMRCVEEDRALLKGNGIEYVEVTYEDFCSNREKFYTDLFSYMKVDYLLPKSSSFSVMVPDIREAITNFDELESRVSSMFSLHQTSQTTKTFVGPG